jgi:hypothetical protein
VELRRQLADQAARSEDLVRQIAANQAALDERRQVEAELRRQLADQAARSQDSVSDRSSGHAAGAD